MVENKWAALHQVAGNGHEAVVRLLLEKEADVKAKAKIRDTVLRWAAHNGHFAVELLLQWKEYLLNVRFVR
jgi:ankyrin repeat protein